MSKHNENSRVKIPALVHLTRLGYQYLSLKNTEGLIDKDTNIFIEIFRESINKINGTDLHIDDIRKLIEEIKVVLYNEDLGKAFYQILLHGHNGLKLIDFEQADNTFHCVTELTYGNGADEFRPDITLLINGMPLVFIEVKKPNNKDGIQAEYNRMNKRSQNKKFRRFLNITQIMVFSNNSEYDDNEVVPLEGAFYAATSYDRLFFNRFREEDEAIFYSIPEIEDEKENQILKDTNYISIKGSDEYITNLDQTSPTNRILTSLFSMDRLMMILKYAVAYVERTNDSGITTLEKHLMRYPQLFATQAIEKRLDAGVKNGIIWHTQGSGKTALAYYNVRYLKDYYQKRGIIAKFYFIVDRLDLLTQAADEFRARGLFVETVNSKGDFIANIKETGQANTTGEDAITVLNIQKFSEESVAGQSDYNVNVQRIYFLDEAHRSYKHTGSFLANLMASDRNAVMIALTGTPLIGEGYNSKDVFGDYIHKYYYNRSILDGYTLKLIREEISTTYKLKLRSALDKIEAMKGSLKREEIYAHSAYVTPLVEYIVDDFDKSRISLANDTIGALIVCDSSKQAKAVYELMQRTNYSSALILHDVDDTEIRKQKRNEFKKGTIDFLIVFNMLLTGFDAPRLKKLYLGRVIREHSLLQALTRVNRPYEKMRYGYVVDFADIRKEFDKTNKAYFDELQAELGDAFKQYDNIFKTTEEIESDLQLISEKLFLYDTYNAEIFSQQISSVENKEELIELRKALELYKELFNVAKLFGYDELAEKFNLSNINALYTEVVNRINLLNLKEALNKADDMSGILNLALDDIEFQFTKISEEELIIADSFRDALDKTRQEMQRSLDPADPEYITLLEELQRLLKKKNIEELTAEEMKENMQVLNSIRIKAEQVNRADQMLAHKYEDDPKFMRTHKRLQEAKIFDVGDMVLHQILLGIKHKIDENLLANEHMIDNEAYFKKSLESLVKQELVDKKVPPVIQQIKYMDECVATEYVAEHAAEYTTERNYTN